MRKIVIITGLILFMVGAVWWYSRLEYKNTVLDMVKNSVQEETKYIQGHLNDHFNFVIQDVLDDYNIKAPSDQRDLWEKVRHLIVANPFLEVVNYIGEDRRIKFRVPYEAGAFSTGSKIVDPIVQALEKAESLGRPVLSRPYKMKSDATGYSLLVPTDGGGFFQLELAAAKLFSSQGGHSHRNDILLRVMDGDTVVYESPGFFSQLASMNNRSVEMKETLYDRPIRLYSVPSLNMNVSDVILLRVALVGSFLISVSVLAALVLLQSMHSKERERVSLEVERREKNLSDTFDAVQDGIAILDRDLVIVRVNKTLELWYGPAKPLVGQKCYSAFHVRDEPCLVCPTVAALKSGQPEQAEIPLVRDGEERGWLEVYSYPKFDGEGQPNGVVEYFRDITERKRAEDLLRQSEEQYRSFFENNHAVMLTIEPESGFIIDANPAACNFYGYPYEVIKQKKIMDINSLSREEIEAEIYKAKNKFQKYYNFQHRLANGEIRDVEVYSGPVNYKGKSYLFSIIHDITERKLVEEERERLIAELKEALSEVKTLQGFIPICANCKKNQG